MDACAPRRGPSCCPCVSFGFDLASMASSLVRFPRRATRGSRRRYRRCYLGKTHPKAARWRLGRAQVQKPDLSSQKILLCVGCKERRLRGRTSNPHARKRSARPTRYRRAARGRAGSASSQRSPWVQRPQERAHPASAEEPQRHRRVDKSTLCSGHRKKCSRRASSTPRARCGGGGGAACRATGGSSARSGAAPRPRRSARTSSARSAAFWETSTS